MSQSKFISQLIWTPIAPGPITNPSLLSLAAIPSRVSIAPISNWPVGTIPSALVFSITIDEVRLRKAISLVAGAWPTVCGRYGRETTDSGQWEYHFDLTQSQIPFSTQTIVRSEAFPNTDVVQPFLNDYIPSLSPTFYVPNSDSPLLSIRLTHLIHPSTSTSSPASLPHSFVLGIAFAHILGDASSAHRFLRHLAFFYTHSTSSDSQSSPPTLEPMEYPTFFPHANLPIPAPKSLLESYKVDQLKDYEIKDAFEKYEEAAKDSEVVTWRLRPEEVECMRLDAIRGEGEREGRMSDQDVISGWWVTVLQRAGVKVERLIYTINYRTLHPSHPDFPANLPTLAGNVAQMRSIPIQRTSSKPLSAGDISRMIRDELERLRASPQLTIEWLRNAAHVMKASVDQGRTQCLVPPEGEALINSNLRYDWAIPFDAIKPHYHTTTSLIRFLRVFQTNGITETASAGTEDSSKWPELIFRVPKGSKERYDEILNSDKARWRV